jgi:hypothetical protein
MGLHNNSNASGIFWICYSFLVIVIAKLCEEICARVQTKEQFQLNVEIFAGLCCCSVTEHHCCDAAATRYQVRVSTISLSLVIADCNNATINALFFSQKATSCLKLTLFWLSWVCAACLIIVGVAHSTA